MHEVDPTRSIVAVYHAEADAAAALEELREAGLDSERLSLAQRELQAHVPSWDDPRPQLRHDTGGGVWATLGGALVGRALPEGRDEPPRGNLYFVLVRGPRSVVAHAHVVLGTSAVHW